MRACVHAAVFPVSPSPQSPHWRDDGVAAVPNEGPTHLCESILPSLLPSQFTLPTQHTHNCGPVVQCFVLMFVLPYSLFQECLDGEFLSSSEQVCHSPLCCHPIALSPHCTVTPLHCHPEMLSPYHILTPFFVFPLPSHVQNFLFETAGVIIVYSKKSAEVGPLTVISCTHTHAAHHLTGTGPLIATCRKSVL